MKKIRKISHEILKESIDNYYQEINWMEYEKANDNRVSFEESDFNRLRRLLDNKKVILRGFQGDNLPIKSSVFREGRIFKIILEKNRFNQLSIFKGDDEWFFVEITKWNNLNSPGRDRQFKCDQVDGLFTFVKNYLSQK